MSDDDYPSRSLDRIMIRLPDGMRERLKEAAEKNKRSVTAEVVARLEQSFAPANLFAMGEASSADENGPQALAFKEYSLTRGSLLEHIRAKDLQPLSEIASFRFLAALLDSVVKPSVTDAIAQKVADAVDDRLSDAVFQDGRGRRVILQIKHTDRSNASTYSLPVGDQRSELEVETTPKPVIASSTPAKSDPRARTSLSTKPVKGKGIRIDRRYTRPAMSAYERLRQSARDAEASKAELEALQAKFPATPNIAPLSAPDMEVLLRTGVRPAKVPETVEKALTLRKSAAKESRIRDPNEPRPIRTRKKVPKDDDAS